MDGIIFDIDGTLWDSTESVAKAWNHAIIEHANLDLHLTGISLMPLFGKTMDEIEAALFPDFTPAKREELGNACYEYENKFLYEEPGILFPHVKEVFQTLSKSHNIYIVSNCQCGYIEAFLQTTGLESYIKDSLCFGQTNLPKGKTIRILMERNHLQNVVYVGDTQGDYDACQMAEIPFIYASYGFGQVSSEVCSIQGLDELPPLLENWNKKTERGC